MVPLYQCPDCQREVSGRAAACPHCGCPLDALSELRTIEPTNAASGKRNDAPPTDAGQFDRGADQESVRRVQKHAVGCFIHSLAYLILVGLAMIGTTFHPGSSSGVSKPRDVASLELIGWGVVLCALIACFGSVCAMTLRGYKFAVLGAFCSFVCLPFGVVIGGMLLSGLISPGISARFQD